MQKIINQIHYILNNHFIPVPINEHEKYIKKLIYIYLYVFNLSNTLTN